MAARSRDDAADDVHNAVRAGADPVCCRLCGAKGSGGAAATALGWSCETDGDGTRWVCPACVRENVRAIEGKLPAEYW
ncbi:hypothetical protein BJF85_16165 [Saccharomonospora sp. CUA-673]|nr:hypothetical protein BJF85_16165 [Saccharomonospora sp. CUA-673]